MLCLLQPPGAGLIQHSSLHPASLAAPLHPQLQELQLREARKAKSLSELLGALIVLEDHLTAGPSPHTEIALKQLEGSGCGCS